MRRISSVLLLLVACATVRAQVLSPVEIKDPDLRALQERYLDDLQQLGASITSAHWQYPFYLSRKLDLDEQHQKGADQRSIRFDRYNGKTVLEITGNYYAAYSSEKMTPEQRTKQTFDSVVVPILKLAVPPFQGNSSVQGYAFEISHHVLGKVMGVSVEQPENLVVVLPQKAAIRFLGARDDNVRQGALLQGEFYLNARPMMIWLEGQVPQNMAKSSGQEDAPAGESASTEIVSGGGQTAQPVAATPPPQPAKPADPPPPPPRDTSPQALASLQAANKELLSGMVKELDSQAHFVSYAAPSFVAFRKQTYLELSINTTLGQAAGGSRYKLAALAFDDHVAHLIRPVLGYFKDDTQFDGIGFSANLHLAGKASAGASSEAVEFFFPFPALRCYEHYDCTGQQLLDAGTVLVNGERVGLDLQNAEGGSAR